MEVDTALDISYCFERHDVLTELIPHSCVAAPCLDLPVLISCVTASKFPNGVIAMESNTSQYTNDVSPVQTRAPFARSAYAAFMLGCSVLGLAGADFMCDRIQVSKWGHCNGIKYIKIRE